VRTPLFLAEVTELFRSGKAIPPTKIGVLSAVIRLLEDSDEHHVSLLQAPLSGHAGEYLGALSMEMTEKGGVEIDEADARAIVNSVSAALQKAGQIGTQPDPSSVLNDSSISNFRNFSRLEASRANCFKLFVTTMQRWSGNSRSNT
jgi:hypothetical protein